MFKKILCFLISISIFSIAQEKSEFKEIMKLTPLPKELAEIVSSYMDYYIAAVTNNNEIKVWKVRKNEPPILMHIIPGEGRIIDIVITNKYLISQNASYIKIWDLITGKLLNTIMEDNIITTMNLNFDENLLAVSTNNGNLKIYKLTFQNDNLTSELINTSSYDNVIRSIVFSKDNEYVYYGLNSGEIYIKKLNDNTFVSTLFSKVSKGDLQKILISNDNKFLIVFLNDNKFTIINEGIYDPDLTSEIKEETIIFNEEKEAWVQIKELLPGIFKFEILEPLEEEYKATFIFWHSKSDKKVSISQDGTLISFIGSDGIYINNPLLEGNFKSLASY